MAAIEAVVTAAAPVAAEHASSDAADLLKLLTFLSPAFPIGAFAYSHGLETRIADGAIGSAETLAAWIADLIELGSAWNDVVLLTAAYRAAAACDDTRLAAVAELALALAPARERALETAEQGAAFLAAAEAAWPGLLPSAQPVALVETAYPIAVARVAAAHVAPLASVLPAFLHAFVVNQVAVGVRLIPLGQSEGLRVVTALHARVLAVTRRALVATLDDLGGAAFHADIAAMRHEDLSPRLFRT
jgi:urease accessory protein